MDLVSNVFCERLDSPFGNAETQCKNEAEVWHLKTNVRCSLWGIKVSSYGNQNGGFG